MDSLIALPEGTVLAGEYRIQRVLGAGGFGITYLAIETTLDRRVAIKEYFPSDFAVRGSTSQVHSKSQGAAQDYAWGLERFIEEAQTLARFDHSNIARVFRYFRANNTGYMVLQFEEGLSFKRWFQGLGKPPSQTQLDQILLPLLSALELVHTGDFLHRDIAPDNIIIRADGTPVLIDFGSARGEVAQNSKTVSALVKPGYSPFEQYAITGKRQGPWTDIYALAATLYHAMAGVRPHDAPSRLTSDDLEPIAVAAKGRYRPGFLAAIDHALALAIEDRPQSVADWRHALFRQGEEGSQPAASQPQPAPPQPPGRRLPAGPAPATRKLDDSAQPELRWRPRREPEAVAAAAVADKADDQPNGKPGASWMSGMRRVSMPPLLKPRGQRRSLMELVADARSEMANYLPNVPWGQSIPWGEATTRNETSAERAGKPGRSPSSAAGPSAETQSPSPLKVRAKNPTPGDKASGNQASKEPAAALDANARHSSKTEQLAAGEAAQAGAAKARKGPGDDAAGKPPVADVKKAEKNGKASEAKAADLSSKDKDRKAAAQAKAKPKAKPAAPQRRADAETGRRAVFDKAGKREGRTKGSGSRYALIIRLAVIVLLVSAMVKYRDAFLGGASVSSPTVSSQRAANFSLERTLRGHESAVTSIAVAGGSNAIVSAAGNFINIWDASTGQVVRTLSVQDVEINSVAAFGDRVLAGLSDGSLILWNMTTGEQIDRMKRHNGPVFGVTFAGAPERFYSASQDQRVRIWDLRWGTRRSLTGHSNDVMSVAYSDKNNLVVSGGADRSLRLWNGRRRRLIRAYEGHSDDVRAVALSGDGTKIASASNDRTVKLWSTRSKDALFTFTGHTNRVVAVDFSPDGRLIASGSEDGTVKIWDTTTGALVHTLEGHSSPVRSVAFFPDGERLISAGDDQTVRVWNVRVPYAS